eukprot:TRINITY_DN8164_c0_g1_i1.p1 TRINITY_DN8164_c0_g1~~TRINITY_DN8164_c0_g1_i1.p1  ORF type:complete len:524 (+),score=107.61 TRINITY_DN8164_c0_g1_i1:289-1860(+)
MLRALGRRWTLASRRLLSTESASVKREFDVCVIGGGPAGYAAAMRAWDFGKSVCLVERSHLGGCAIRNGVLTSKTLWELSRDYRSALRKDRGFVASNVQVDYARVTACVADAVAEKTEQLSRQVEILSHCQPGRGDAKLTYLRGTAEFVDKNTVAINDDQPGIDRIVTAENFVIATGSRPRLLDGIDVDGTHIMTSDHVLNLTSFPKSMVILGGGVVGCEFATIFANFGQTKVYLIDRADRILPSEDLDVASCVSVNLEKKGVTIHHRSKLVSMKVIDGQVEYVIQHHSGGLETIRVERALISVGRVPNTERLSLANAGVQITPQGYVVDTDTQTTQANIYAAGDVTQDVALVNVGEIEARHAVERMYGQPCAKLSYENISAIMFLDPEVASIGMNEQYAHSKKIPYRVASYSYALVNRTVAMRATDGFVKILCTDDDEMRILGMRALGAHASTTIEAVSLLIQHQRSARDLAELLHPHPAVTEGVQECVRMLLGTSVYKPEVFKSELRLSRVEFPPQPAQPK